jgi:phosphoglycerate dehydrogenase-like enzyme
MPATIWNNLALPTPAQEALERGAQSCGFECISEPNLDRYAESRELSQISVAFGSFEPAELTECRALRWVALSTAGYTPFDIPAVRSEFAERGICLTNSSSVYANPCAEHALAMMLAMARRLPQFVQEKSVRSWKHFEGRAASRVLSNSTVLLLGFGAIGRRLAELLTPFRCRVIAFRRSPQPVDGIAIITGIDATVLAEADHIVNVLPASTSTAKLCGSSFFRQVKHGACFYNVGRGATVDQDALLAALRSGRLAGAWLDALDPEPLPVNSPLWDQPTCQITPHVAGGQPQEELNLVRHFLANLSVYRSGGIVTDRVL